MNETEFKPYSVDTLCCVNCCHFDKRVKFCRANPPQVITLPGGNGTEIVAKFPKIEMPQIDYCSLFERKDIL